ncbi:MAG: transposase [Nitrosomonas sp.]|nr:transposase [Nitrosomonas sp.]
MKNQISYSPEVRERAVRLVFEQQREHESQWSAIKSIASKIGCAAETLRTWVRRAETDQEFEVVYRHRTGKSSRNWNGRIVN